MDEIILHHYPASPVSEKVRVALGIKNLPWRSVQVSRLPPREELFVLTGGFRRVPVMQIGADIYCDSQCILRELDRRFPKPSFFPAGIAGLPFGLSRWIDGALFDEAVRLAFAPMVDTLPADLVNDRARLYLGPEGDFRRELQDLPHQEAQLRAQIGWLDQALADGRKFLLDDAPGLADCLAYYIIWFLRGRWDRGPEFLREFDKLTAWEKRVKALGHGRPSAMTAEEALEIGINAQPKTPEQSDARDSLGLAPGMDVEIVTDADSGETPVRGVIRAINRETISIHRIDLDAGMVCLHFPRVGYRVSASA